MAKCRKSCCCKHRYKSENERERERERERESNTDSVEKEINNKKSLGAILYSSKMGVIKSVGKNYVVFLKYSLFYIFFYETRFCFFFFFILHIFSIKK